MQRGVYEIYSDNTEQCREALRELREGRVACVHFIGFLGRNQARDVAGRMLATCSFKQYAHVKDLAKVGFALSEVRHADDMKEYLSWAERLDALIEQSAGCNPIDDVQRWMASAWGGGVARATFSRFTFPRGIVRYQRTGWSGEVSHIDFPPRIVLEQARYNDPVQWGINLYLDVPSVGGSLLIWSERHYTPEEYKRLKRESAANFSSARLGKPSISLDVNAGDLVVFPTHFPHAVSSIISGERVSCGYFSLVGKSCDPLVVWA